MSRGGGGKNGRACSRRNVDGSIKTSLTTRSRQELLLLTRVPVARMLPYGARSARWRLLKQRRPSAHQVHHEKGRYGNGVMEQWGNGDIALDSVRIRLLKKTQRHPLLSTDPGRRSQCAGSAEAKKKATALGIGIMFRKNFHMSWSTKRSEQLGSSVAR